MGERNLEKKNHHSNLVSIPKQMNTREPECDGTRWAEIILPGKTCRNVFETLVQVPEPTEAPKSPKT